MDGKRVTIRRQLLLTLPTNGEICTGSRKGQLLLLLLLLGRWERDVI